MDQDAYEIRLNQWEKLIHEANACGKTKKQWCIDNGVSAKQFYYWQRKVRRRAIEKSRALPEKNSSGFAALVPLAEKTSYIETTIAEASDPQETNSAPAVVLCCADYRILIGDSISEQTLKTVLRAIKNA